MAIIFMLMASACFVTMSAIVKAMGQSLPLTELMFLRCLIAMPFLLTIQLKGSKPLVTKAWKVLLVRALFGRRSVYYKWRCNFDCFKDTCF
jgi:drug/metabolite transporter (DMT)-like permease